MAIVWKSIWSFFSWSESGVVCHELHKMYLVSYSIVNDDDVSKQSVKT